ncbi:zf-HC2 domain-containing protein [Halomonas mongoliensis]|uniref:zf-HC2 domain-containing protein n=1 Tax=Halomonas mongoliensis TaxID=321265 RepID=UPI00403AFEAB
MLMCKGATRLMSLKQDRRLTLQERISLRLHLSMCGACRQCDRQFSLLHQLGARFESHLADASGEDASRQAGLDRSE